MADRLFEDMLELLADTSLSLLLVRSSDLPISNLPVLATVGVY
jgi:hypothetical protein